MESGAASDPGVSSVTDLNGESVKKHRMRIFHKSKSGIRSLMSRPHSRTGSVDNEPSDDIEHSPSPSSSSSTDANELVLQVSILRARHLYAKLEV